jgi:hypothetical protein
MIDRPSVRTAAIAVAAYAALAIAYTWPLAIHLNGVPHDRGDPLLTTWFLWWSGTQAVPLSTAWWNAPAFYPAAGVFAFSEHLTGLVWIAAPLTLLTGQPLVGHNVTFIATYALGALAAHFLGYTLTRRHDAGVVAALAFAFAPYRLPQAPHLQVLASFWTPLCLAALHRFNDSKRTRWIAIAAAAWLLQGLSCGYFTFFLGVLVALWFAWFAIGRWPARQLGIAVAAFVAAALALAPFLLGYERILRDTYGFRRSIGEMNAYGADAVSLLSAGEDLLVWSWVHAFQRPESDLFPGVTIAVLAGYALYRARPLAGWGAEPRWRPRLRQVLAGLIVVLSAASAMPFALGSWQLSIGGVRLVSISRGDKPLSLAFVAALALIALLPAVIAAYRRTSVRAFYMLAAFLTWVFALGPDPTFLGQRFLYRAPYSWLMLMPGFDGLRVPARFWTMTLVCLAVVGALVVDRVQPRLRRTIVILAVIGLLLDGWPRRFVVVAAPPLRPAPADAAVRLDLPATDAIDAQALYQQMFERKPIVNGSSGYDAPHYPALKAMLDDDDGRALEAVGAYGPLGVVVDHAGDADGALRAMIRRVPGARAVRSEADWSSYLLPRTEPHAVPVETGAPIHIRRVSASSEKTPPELAVDGRLDTHWTGGPQREPVTFTIELDEPSHVSQIVTALGPRFMDFPRRLTIDVSPDGQQWQTVSNGSVALETYYAALAHPKDVPIVLPIGRDAVRFIRLTQTGSSKDEWSIAEVRVLR